MADDLVLDPRLIQIVEDEAAANGRTVSEQVAHWLLIGRAIERSGALDFARVEAFRAGELTHSDLRDNEYFRWEQGLLDWIKTPTHEEIDFFADRRANGLGVGLDDNGEIVHARVDKIHPGIWLARNILRSRGISIAEFAGRCRLPMSTLHRFLEGKAPLALNWARAIEAGFGISAEKLMHMQSDFDRSSGAGADGAQ